MNRKIRIVLRVYLAGIVLFELTALRATYVMGGFSRIQSVRDIRLGVAASLAVNALWPIVAIIIALRLLGILPSD